MNRIIKFRGKREDDEEWVYGTGIVQIQYNTYDTKRVEIVNKVNYDELDYFLPVYDSEEVIPETIGQFTGLYDKKTEKEIYTGDIVKFNLKNDSQGQPDIIGYIEYQTTFCAYRIMSFKGSFALDYNIKDIEVIGNIFDNKNLLEEK